MARSFQENYLEDTVRQLEKLRSLAEGALAQVDNDQLFEQIGPEVNSIATNMKHVAGNMLSRWTDFLTTDGEKPDRDRDSEFELGPEDTPANVRARWDNAWGVAIRAIESLKPADLTRTVTIRGEPHTVVEAINRQMSHYSYHVGQIVQLAKYFAAESWKTLSIPKGQSKDFDVNKAGARYKA
jgi:hypothetical protein